MVFEGTDARYTTIQCSIDGSGWSSSSSLATYSCKFIFSPPMKSIWQGGLHPLYPLKHKNLIKFCVVGIHQWNVTLPLLQQYFVSWTTKFDGHVKVSTTFTDTDIQNNWELQFTFWAYQQEHPGTKVVKSQRNGHSNVPTSHNVILVV